MSEGREIDYRQAVAQEMARITGSVMSADPESLAQMCEKWGVRAPIEDAETPSWQALTLAQMYANGDSPAGILELANAQMSSGYLTLSNDERADALCISNDELPELLGVDFDDLTSDEIGRPGTPFTTDLPRTELTHRLSPYRARGLANRPGVYEEHGKEFITYKNIQGIKEFLVNVQRWRLDVPADCPDHLKERVEDACARIWTALKNIPGGWESFCEDAASCFQFGFSLFEVVWGDVDGYALPVKIAFREASSVLGWLTDADQRRLAGVKCRPGGRSSESYTLPAYGERTEHHRVLLNVVGRRGLNFEGIPPTRIADVLIVKKKLLLTIQAACAEKFGAPILKQWLDPSMLHEMMQWDDAQFEELYHVLAAMSAMDVAVVKMPYGANIDYVTPEGTPPDFQSQIEYIDKQLALLWSAQGDLLGQTGHGSHALAQVQENDLFRSAPYYARIITRSLNELIRHICKVQFKLDLPTYPRLVWRVEDERDVTQQITDITSFLEIREQLDPEDEAAMAAKLGIKPMTRKTDAPQVPALAIANREAADVPDARTLDAAEAEMTAGFRRLGRHLQKRWRELVRDNETREDVLRDRATIKAEFEPLYQAVVEEAMRALGEEAQAALLEDMELEDDVSFGIDDQLALLMVSVAEEALNRSVGVATDAQVNRERGSRFTAVPVLATSTLASIAARASSSAYNTARHQVIEQTQEQFKTIWATRDAMMDSSTGGPCREYDGVRVKYGSKRYRDLTPPNHCKDGHRCRCRWNYITEPKNA